MPNFYNNYLLYETISLLIFERERSEEVKIENQKVNNFPIYVK